MSFMRLTGSSANAISCRYNYQRVSPSGHRSNPILSFSRPCKFQARSSSTSIHDSDHSYYNYTSGRWLYNESLRLAERRHKFDVNGLCKVAARAIGKSSDDITRFTKLAEGGSYRVFEINFRGGQDVIARLPYPSVIPRTYGIASEAATMSFLRLNGIPVPEVYDWDSSSLNAIGSEYMIMEKCLGQELESIWYSMEIQQRKAIVEKFVELECRLSALELPASGSLFFKNSLHPGITTVELPPAHGISRTQEFCVGPSTERLWWYMMRHELDISQGPWMNTQEAFTAVGKREIAWLQKFGRPRLPREPVYRSIHKHKLADPQEQISNLSNFLKIANHLAPKDEELNRPILRHPDLSPKNVFISQSGEISGVIDWQHCVALPQLLQAKMPRHFQNFGDDESESFKPPRLPEDFESMEEDDKTLATELYRRRQLHYFYLGFTHRDNQVLFRAILSPDMVARNRLYEAASRPWEGDSISLKAELIRTTAEWPKLADAARADAACPIKFTDKEVEECLALDARQQEADEKMQQFRDHLGINIDGWVSNEMYAEATIKNQDLKDKMLSSVDTDDERNDINENWPFQDHEEID